MRFSELLDQRLLKTRKVLEEKAKEYASEEDRFYNFKIAAEIGDTTPEKALYGFMLKHIVSVLDLIEHKDKRTSGLIDEKIGDTINYLILLEGLLRGCD